MQPALSLPCHSHTARTSYHANRWRPGQDHAGLAWGLLAAVIWGGFLAVSRFGVDLGLAPADLAFIRYATAGIVLLPWLVRKGLRNAGGIGWVRAIILALLAGPLFVLVGTSGFRFAPLAHSAVLQLGSVTMLGIVLSALLAGESIGKVRAIGLLTIVAGLIVTAGPGLLVGGSHAWKGDLLFAAAGAMWAVFTVLQRRWRADPMAATAAVSVLSLLVYVPVYLAIRGPQPILAVDPWLIFALVVMLGIISGIVALFAFGRTVSHLGAARASLFPALAPGIAMLLGIPLAGEIPARGQIFGLVILTSGLLVALRGAPVPAEAPRRP